MRKRTPFLINQIVKAKVGYPPKVIVGHHYRVVEMMPAKSYSGWMVSIARPDFDSKEFQVIETLDSEYFMELSGNDHHH